jgi:CRISPR-associated protein Cas5d
MFERRAAKGQHFHQPYLGCREFAADVRLVGKDAAKSQPVAETRDLGWMLYDMDFSDPSDVRPIFFRPVLQSGVIEVPSPDNPEVRR